MENNQYDTSEVDLICEMLKTEAIKDINKHQCTPNAYVIGRIMISNVPCKICQPLDFVEWSIKVIRKANENRKSKN